MARAREAPAMALSPSPSLWVALALLLALPGGGHPRGVPVGHISVENGGPWGEWGEPEFCPKGSYATGFQLKVEDPQGSGDDTGLNAIRLLCDGAGTVTSSQGVWGRWSRAQFCPTGQLTAFRLRTEEQQGRGDDTAANALDFRCSQGHLLQGAGSPWGSWGAWSPACAPGGICGLQTRVEYPQGRGDDTALNDVRFFCCQ